jgi:hypothetical protein
MIVGKIAVYQEGDDLMIQELLSKLKIYGHIARTETGGTMAKSIKCVSHSTEVMLRE